MANNLTSAYIYPIKTPSDCLNMWLYPDDQKETYGAVIPSESHPSLGHSVSQTFGRESPKRSFSLVFDNIHPSDEFGRNPVSIYKKDDVGANFARDWIRRNMGPDFDRSKPSAYRAQYFVVKLLGPAFIMAVHKVELSGHIASKDTESVRRFRASFEGEEAFPIDLNPAGLSGKRRRRGGNGGQAEGSAYVDLPLFRFVAGIYGNTQKAFDGSQIPPVVTAYFKENP